MPTLIEVMNDNRELKAEIESLRTQLAERVSQLEKDLKETEMGADAEAGFVDELNAENARLREALKFYGKSHPQGEWIDHVCDSYSGLAYAFDWPGDVQDEPWEVAERALSRQVTAGFAGGAGAGSPDERHPDSSPEAPAKFTQQVDTGAGNASPQSEGSRGGDSECADNSPGPSTVTELACYACGGNRQIMKQDKLVTWSEPCPRCAFTNS